MHFPAATVPLTHWWFGFQTSQDLDQDLMHQAGCAGTQVIHLDSLHRHNIALNW